MNPKSHAKAYLEALFQPPSLSGTIGSRPSGLIRSASGIGLSASGGETNNYKPTKSSGLAVKGDKEDAEEDGEGKFDDDVASNIDPDVQAAITSAASITSAAEDDEYDPSSFLGIQTTPSRPPSHSTSSTMHSVQAIMRILDDKSLDDEERIDRVRNALADRLGEVEGGQVSAVQLDNVVLSLLHRHREDKRPTGATFTMPASPSPSPFPASPRSRPRPASLRSSSGNTAGLTRPWTPNLPMTPTGASMNQENGPSVPSSPLSIPQTISIGNGSPRASPSLWHRSIPSSANPWAQSSPVSATSSVFAPLGPPGDTIGSPPKTSNVGDKSTASLISATPVATLSRPASPGNGAADSPRLNVAAVEFRPRTSKPHSQQTTPQKAAPWLTDGTEGGAQTGLQDSDEDEFSPFVSQGGVALNAVHVPSSSSSSSASSSRLAIGRARPISGASGNSSIQSLTTADSISGSYHGSTTSASLESCDDQRGPNWPAISGEDELDSLAMTPFDVLSSVLSSSNVGASSWSSEQIEEALESNNWDVDATLSAIMESGGMPGPSASLPKSPGLTSKAASAIEVPVPGRSGVSVVSRSSLAGQRGSPASPSIWGSERGATAGSPAPSNQSQQGGAVGPGRVCRYFLAGECRRADCRFSHDLNRAVCRFWMKGQCLNGDGCSFLHDMSIVDKLTNRLSTVGMPAASNALHSDVETPPNDEFPELGLAPTGPKAQRGKVINGSLTPGAAGASDPSRTRWAQALQKRAHTPIALVQQGESHLHLHHKATAGSPAKGTPTGPRGAISSATLQGGAGAPRIPLHAPLLLPTLSTGKDASQAYSAYRDVATSLSDKRNKMLARAAEAWKKGDGAEARKWSREGQGVNKTLQEESRNAAKALLQERHQKIQRQLVEDTVGSKGLVDPSRDERGSRGQRGKLMGDLMGVCLGVAPRIQNNVANTTSLSLEERMEVLLDLHSLHSTEAIDFVEAFLIGLEKENYRGLALLAVGLGKHTSQETDRRRVGLALGVRGFLNSWSYPYTEHNGVIVVDPLTHL